MPTILRIQMKIHFLLGTSVGLNIATFSTKSCIFTSMKTGLLFNRNFAIFGIPFLLFGAIIMLLKSPIPLESNSFALAFTIDLLITIPAVYFLLIRKTTIPKTTTVPVMIIGLLIGSFLLPEHQQGYLNLFKTWALPVIELSVITYLVFNVRKALKKYKDLKSNAPDFYTALKNTSKELFPGMAAHLITTEVAVFYYGFVHWKAIPIKENEFSYHKKSSTPTLLIAFILVIAIEAVGLHALIAKWSITLAWIMSILSVYSAFQLLGISKSISKRPIRIMDKSVILRFGILNEVEIPFSAIESIELSNKQIDKDAGIKTISPLSGMDSTNTILHLNSELILTGLYGIKKPFQSLAFHVDEAADFKLALENKLHSITAIK